MWSRRLLNSSWWRGCCDIPGEVCSHYRDRDGSPRSTRCQARAQHIPTRGSELARWTLRRDWSYSFFAPPNSSRRLVSPVSRNSRASASTLLRWLLQHELRSGHPVSRCGARSTQTNESRAAQPIWSAPRDSLDDYSDSSRVIVRRIRRWQSTPQPLDGDAAERSRDQ
jgi:hypothetical protein